MKTYPQLKAENEKLRERLLEANSALQHGNMPGWVLTDHTEAVKGLLALVDGFIDAYQVHPSSMYYEERNVMAEKLGLDKRDK